MYVYISLNYIIITALRQSLSTTTWLTSNILIRRKLVMFMHHDNNANMECANIILSCLRLFIIVVLILNLLYILLAPHIQQHEATSCLCCYSNKVSGCLLS